MPLFDEQSAAMSFGDIAQALGLTRSTVQGYYKRAMCKLRAMPQEEFARFAELVEAKREFVEYRAQIGL